MFEYEVRVQNAELPDNYRDTFDIELWQYPYTSAEYYNVEPFSDEHLEIMKSSMELYKKAGGHAITASIIEGCPGTDRRTVQRMYIIHL